MRVDIIRPDARSDNLLFRWLQRSGVSHGRVFFPRFWILLVRTIFLGDTTLLVRCADYALDRGDTIAAIVSRDAQVLAWARDKNLTTIVKPDQGLGATPWPAHDVLFSAGNLDLVPADRLPASGRAFNFHDGPLPAYAGLNVTSHALLAGERTHAITWHEMTARTDAGHIAVDAPITIAEGETAFSLNTKCYEAGIAAFRTLYDQLRAGTLALRPQTGERRWYGSSRRPPAAATIDPAQPADTIVRLVAALDFGPYANPLAAPKLVTDEQVFVVGRARIGQSATVAAPGTILARDADALTIATATQPVIVSALTRPCGTPILDLTQISALTPGTIVPPLTAERRTALDSATAHAAKHEAHWITALDRLETLELPYPSRHNAVASNNVQVHDAGTAPMADALAAALAWIGRLTNHRAVAVRYRDRATMAAVTGVQPWFSPDRLLSVSIEPSATVSTLRAHITAQQAACHAAGPIPCDLGARRRAADRGRAGLAAATIAITLEVEPPAQLPAGCHLLIAIASSGRVALLASEDHYTPATAVTMARHLAQFIAQAQALPSSPLTALSLVPPDEQVTLVGPRVAVPGSTIDAVIETALRASPERIAVTAGTTRLSARDLMTRADTLAAALATHGVRPGDIVGLCHTRSADLVVAVLAILKSGASYLPLDPEYPAERIRFMLEDSRAAIVVTDAATTARVPSATVRCILTDTPRNTVATPAISYAAPDARAYLIYTSGSTGKPKGVEVTHANVLNFFAGLDARVPHANGGTWLAVTSLNFDISVLELLWTLARGFTVALHGAPATVAAGGAMPNSPLFSLFYFTSARATETVSAYRLLMEGAKFADRNGFESIWTPERHFHEFGGPFPNPAITSAAIAATTSRVKIRTGSCVVPLHDPLRIAEDYAMIDNLSAGRIGIACASGWQPDDFVLAPSVYERRKDVMIENIETVRKLWRGERIVRKNAIGKDVATATYPRPVQSDIPIWLTAARNPETFEMAGRLGYNVLTHLLGMTFEEVAGNVALYRKARADAGHIGPGHVTLMLHTFVGTDADTVRETVRAPMKHYLGSALDLVKSAAWSFPTLVKRAGESGKTPADLADLGQISAEDNDALLDHAFNRYYATSGLFGTVETARAQAQKAKAAGVDEIACFIDFGVDVDTVLANLPNLAALRDSLAADMAPPSVAADITHYGATHLQCTPSMAAMLAADDAGRTALGKLQVLCVGGEALPADLAHRLRTAMPGTFLNMYGPTETTVWSTIADLDATTDTIPLGTPIANTDLAIVLPDGSGCPALVAGELLIGGAGVARGYWQRPELTAERFVMRTGAEGRAQRFYRTGDLVRRHPDNTVEYLGRIDHQIKVRGHRIELGEIEAALAALSGVTHSVVVAHKSAAAETTSDVRLVGYVATTDAARFDTAAARAALAAKLPDIMVPSHIVALARLPLTPNGKIDRAQLPALGTERAVAPAVVAESATGDVETRIAAIWSDLLGVPEVGRRQNFFDLGGHSLMAVQMQRRLAATFGHDVPLTDIFRFPTIATLAERLGGTKETNTAQSVGADRARARLAMRQRQRETIGGGT